MLCGGSTHANSSTAVEVSSSCTTVVVVLQASGMVVMVVVIAVLVMVVVVLAGIAVAAIRIEYSAECQIEYSAEPEIEYSAEPQIEYSVESGQRRSRQSQDLAILKRWQRLSLIFGVPLFVVAAHRRSISTPDATSFALSCSLF